MASSSYDSSYEPFLSNIFHFFLQILETTDRNQLINTERQTEERKRKEMTSPSPKHDSMPSSNDGFGADSLAGASISSPTIQSMIRSSQIKQERHGMGGEGSAHLHHVSLNSSIRQKHHMSYSSHSSVSSGYIKKHKSGKGSSSAVSAKVNDYRKVRPLSGKQALIYYGPIQFSSLIALKKQNTKPLMEKRRRERINRSLEELKNLILDQTNHNVS